MGSVISEVFSNHSVILGVGFTCESHGMYLPLILPSVVCQEDTEDEKLWTCAAVKSE